VTLDTALQGQMDALLAEIEPDIQRSRSPGMSDWFRADNATQRAARTRLHAAIERLAPGGSSYGKEARVLVETRGADDGWLVVRLVGILRALRSDYEAGYVRTVEELVHADVFSDLLEMATELHGSGYKDAAAVIAGSVLEEHLRKLARRHEILAVKANGAHEKADTLNAALTKAGAYNGLVQKQVTSWLALRNNAAHGERDEYDHAQVGALIRDVLDFTAKHPA
jgi:hypothetical protein